MHANMEPARQSIYMYACVVLRGCMHDAWLLCAHQQHAPPETVMNSMHTLHKNACHAHTLHKQMNDVPSSALHSHLEHLV